jgi:hypothetical protein
MIPMRPISAHQPRTTRFSGPVTNGSPKFDCRDDAGANNPSNMVQVNTPQRSMTHLKFAINNRIELGLKKYADAGCFRKE